MSGGEGTQASVRAVHTLLSSEPSLQYQVYEIFPTVAFSSLFFYARINGCFLKAIIKPKLDNKIL